MTEYSSNQPMSADWERVDGEGEKGTQNACLLASAIPKSRKT